MGGTGERPQRDFWGKLEVLLHPVGGMFTALAIAFIGIIGSQMIDRRQAAETDARLYSEIMSRREESETALRKDMLVSVVQSYLQPTAKQLDTRVLNIELLAYNFSESINLKPLFVDLAREIRESGDPRKAEFAQRLQRVAREIASKQSFTLEARGASVRADVDFRGIREKGKGTVALGPYVVNVEGTESEIGLRVIGVDPAEATVRLRLQVTTPRSGGSSVNAEFDVGFYDVPMIDNTRLANGQRCAVTLNNFSAKDDSARLAVVCFPGEYASIKDRPYYDEVIKQLRRVQSR